jgi:MFS family permease
VANRIAKGDLVDETTRAPATARIQTPRKAALSNFLGTAMEFYDFGIYAPASALVLNQLFFPNADPAISLLASFATFGVAYVVRPLGGIVLGNLGDRIGRKRVLMITILLMGIATFCVGLLPTYSQIGVLAPVLLVLLRLLQGFSAGGESPGATALTLEHSPEGRRGYFTSFGMVGFAVGTSIATVVFVPIALLPDDALTTWAWRVPFLFSAVVAVLAFIIRRTMHEPPIFEAMEAEGDTKKAPVVELLKYQKLGVLRVIMMTFLAVMMTTFTVFALAYGTGVVGVDRTAMLIIDAIAIALGVVFIPLAGRLSDRVGRRPVLLAAAIGGSASVFFYFWCISTGSIPLIAIGAVINMSLAFSCYNGVYCCFFSEQFSAPVRYSGMAVGQQLALLITGFTPLIGGLLLGPGVDGWIPVALFVTGCMAVGAVGVIISPETAKVPLGELGTDRIRTPKVESVVVE